MAKAIVNKQLQEIQSKLTELAANLLSLSNNIAKVYSQINSESEAKTYSSQADFTITSGSNGMTATTSNWQIL